MRLFLFFLLLAPFLHAHSIYYLEDKKSILSPQEIIDNQNFKPFINNRSNFGITRSSYWLQIHLDPTIDIEHYIHFTYPLLDQITLYKLESDQLVEKEKIGNLVATKSRSLIEPRLSFHIDASTKVVYLHIKSITPMNLHHHIHTQEEYSDYKAISFSAATFYLGVVIITLLINFIFFYFSKSRSYLYYLLFHFVFLLLLLALNGFLVQYFFSQNPIILTKLIPILILFTPLAFLIFSYEFLNMKQRHPLSKKSIQILTLSTLALILLLPFLHLRTSIHIANLITSLIFSLIFFYSLYDFLKHKSQTVKHYLIVWFPYLFGVSIEFLKNSGLIAINYFTINAMFMGIIIHMIVASIILAYRYHYLEQKNRFLRQQDLFVKDSIHEVRTPLTVITLNNQLRTSKQGLDKHSKQIDAAAKSLSLVYDDLSFSIEQEKNLFEAQYINLAQLLQKRVEFMEVVAQTSQKKINLTISLEASNFNFLISYKELIRLIDNNLSNAIKYAYPKSCIEISLDCNKNQRVALSFTNKGEPIQDTDKIFDRYKRENDSKGGYGLGLSIVKSIAKKYSIQIEVSSNAEVNNFTYYFSRDLKMK